MMIHDVTGNFPYIKFKPNHQSEVFDIFFDDSFLLVIQCSTQSSPIHHTQCVVCMGELLSEWIWCIWLPHRNGYNLIKQICGRIFVTSLLFLTAAVSLPRLNRHRLIHECFGVRTIEIKFNFIPTELSNTHALCTWIKYIFRLVCLALVSQKFSIEYGRFQLVYNSKKKEQRFSIVHHTYTVYTWLAILLTSKPKQNKFVAVFYYKRIF